ncbi:DUF1583 domain-containing protein [Gimesia aquarii]|uniref:DUF1583 domain-containing protein n=1 Tax=Gimesia aquarii TaxID=2527964 RepID=A0A517WX83_9PLAN|nr:DUF1583 domain-containing protein [Gimesia aquarii]QDU09849.1 hypothetical protein V202x_32460 [Gimesia aquarii]
MENNNNRKLMSVNINFKHFNSLILFFLLISKTSLAEENHIQDQITRFDFLEEKFDDKTLKLYGKRTHRFIRPTKEGLRTKLSDEDKVAPIGFGPHFEIPGDFRITATFQIITLDTPSSGYGVGPEIYIGVEGGTSATIGRICRSDGKNVYKAHRATGTGKARKHSVRMFETTNMEGQLRLERKGETLIYSVAEKNDASFREIHRNKFSILPLKTLRVGSSQGDANVNLEFLWKDLEIAILPPTKMPANVNADLVVYLLIAIGILLAVVIFGFCFILKSNLLSKVKIKN